MEWIYVTEKLPTPLKKVEISISIGYFTWVEVGWITKEGVWYDDDLTPFGTRQVVYAYRDYVEPTPAPLKG
jgi:hypothetical protein